MWNAKLCLGTSDEFEMPVDAQIRLFKQAGFEGFFTDWYRDADIAGWRGLADELGMDYQSVHAPFGHAADIWKDDEAADRVVEEMLLCLDDCARYSIPIMVMHAFIGFGQHSPMPEGIANFQKIVDAARRLNVKIALENTEGEEYLAALMERFWAYDCVGFCWDTGHEMCYNHSRDLLRLYGEKLVCTHLNDNLGIRDYHGNITGLDDLHLLPFDGAADWADIAGRLNRHGYRGYLTFELCKKSKPGRHENDAYAQMPLESYIAEAYKRACRVAALKMRMDAGPVNGG